MTHGEVSYLITTMSVKATHVSLERVSERKSNGEEKTV